MDIDEIYKKRFVDNSRDIMDPYIHGEAKNTIRKRIRRYDQRFFVRSCSGVRFVGDKIVYAGVGKVSAFAGRYCDTDDKAFYVVREFVRQFDLGIFMRDKSRFIFIVILIDWNRRCFVLLPVTINPNSIVFLFPVRSAERLWTLPRQVLEKFLLVQRYVLSGILWRLFFREILIIEIFGTFWHPRKEEEQELIALYKEAGYDCLVSWDTEVYDLSYKGKLSDFLGC